MQPINRIIVEIKKKFEDEITTESGITFYKDPTFSPEENVTVHGKVLAIPSKHEREHKDDDFQFNVQVGDELYFNYLVTMDEENLVPGQDMQFMVHYHDAIAVVRDGKIIPVGSYILIDPEIETVVESSVLFIPDHIGKKEENNGTVIASNDPSIPEGSRVAYDEIGKFWNIIEGKKLYCMFNKNVMYVYE